MSDMETRTFTAETRAGKEDGNPYISGYAAMFDAWTDIGNPATTGWRERVRPGFFEGIENQDVRVLVNHDPNILLGRTKAHTASLLLDEMGLRYGAKIDESDAEAVKWHRRIERGDIDGCSFAFTVGSDDWYVDDDGALCRDLLRVGTLYDVGPVTYPAYEQTIVSARSLEAALEARTERTEPEAPQVADTGDAEPGSEPSPSEDGPGPSRKRRVLKARYSSDK